MQESQETTTTAPQELVCWKVWGGNGQVDAPISIPGLRGQLYSRPCGSDRGGDVYYLSACGSGALARLCIADVTGHGSSVATFSAWLEEWTPRLLQCRASRNTVVPRRISGVGAADRFNR